MRLLLIRHAESAGNADGRIQGHLDLELSDLGREQAGRLGQLLERVAPDALYTSPLLRAMQTAEIAVASLRLALVERPALMERDVGGLSGLTGAEAFERFPGLAEARADGGIHTVVPGYEADDAFRQRVVGELDAIIERHAEGTVAAVTHGGVIGAFIRHTMNVPHRQPGAFAIDNASITSFDVADPDADLSRRPRVRIVALNDTCHLD